MRDLDARKSRFVQPYDDIATVVAERQDRPLHEGWVEMICRWREMNDLTVQDSCTLESVGGKGYRNRKKKKPTRLEYTQNFGESKPIVGNMFEHFR